MLPRRSRSLKVCSWMGESILAAPGLDSSNEGLRETVAEVDAVVNPRRTSSSSIKR